MLITNEFEAAQSIDKVWSFFEDIPQVASCLPGADLTNEMGDDRYEGTVAIRLGPVKLEFDGAAEVKERDEANKTIAVDASGADKRGRGQAALQLKVLYWRRKKLYIEHLVFSLHVHAFIFSLLILTIILDYKLTMWLVIISSLIYLYIAMKQFYSQSYSKTATKMVLLLLSYGVTTLLVMALTMVVTAVGLVMGNA